MSEFQVYPTEYLVLPKYGEVEEFNLFRHGLVVKRKGKFSLCFGIYVHKAPELCYNKQINSFEIEPQPSDRTDKYLETHRFGTAEEAIKVAKTIYKEAKFKEVPHAYC